MNKYLGNHLLIEYYGCDREVLKDSNNIEKHMIKAAEDANATIVESVFHTFSPWGVSGVVVIEESHLTIHTWPEYGYAAVDLFTCGDKMDGYRAYEYLKEKLKCKNSKIQEISRGKMNK